MSIRSQLEKLVGENNPLTLRHMEVILNRLKDKVETAKGYGLVVEVDLDSREVLFSRVVEGDELKYVGSLAISEMNAFKDLGKVDGVLNSYLNSKVC